MPAIVSIFRADIEHNISKICFFSRINIGHFLSVNGAPPLKVHGPMIVGHVLALDVADTDRAYATRIARFVRLDCADGVPHHQPILQLDLIG